MKRIEDYIFDFLSASEEAAISCYHTIGRQDKILSDQASVSSLRKSFANINANINIVSGEGVLDNAPSIDLGENIGNGDFAIDVCLDPIDGTTMTAENKMDAMVVIAAAPHKTLLSVPDMYMEKLITRQKLKGYLSLDNSIEENIEIAAKVLNKDVNEITVGCLNKPRHDELKKRIKKTGARINSVDDGDIGLSIITGFGNKIDFMYLIGGAPEGITSAVITKCFDGDMQMRLLLKKDVKGNNDENISYSKKEKKLLSSLNLEDKKIYTLDEICKSNNTFFVATNITDGSINYGVELNKDKYQTNSIILTSINHKSLKIDTLHKINENMNHFVK